MKFILDEEQKLFGETLDKLLSAAGVPEATRAWSAGFRDAGLSLWRSLADAGVFALAVLESAGGVGPLPVELVTAYRVLGRHCVPGPYVETAAVAGLLSRLEDTPFAAEHLPRIASGDAIASIALPPDVPFALDADAADLVLKVDEDGSTLRYGAVRQAHASLDPARRLFTVEPGDVLGAGAGVVLGADVGAGARVGEAAAAAYDMGALLCAAQLSGLGDRLLEITVEYAKTRQQFGRPIGEFQAVKHHLADAYVALEHARPLLHGAALSYGTPDFSRDVSAAKAAASDATYFAARIALQVHGAIGYTDEYDLSLLIRKARALRGAWGSPSAHRARVLDSLRVS